MGVAAGVRLAAAGEDRSAHRQNSRESYASYSSSHKAAESIKTIFGLLCQHLRDAIKKVLINGATTIVRLCHQYIRTTRVHSSVHSDVDIAYLNGLNVC